MLMSREKKVDLSVYDSFAGSLKSEKQCLRNNIKYL